MCEWAFPKMSNVKSKVRQERFVLHTLIFIKQKMASEINIKEVIDKLKKVFTNTKKT